jgi:hypothetical protein
MKYAPIRIFSLMLVITVDVIRILTTQARHGKAGV